MRRFVVLVAGAGMALSLAASPPALAAEEASPSVVNTGWLRTPTSDEIAEAMPARARAAGVSGTATLRCLVNAAGALSQCAVVSEQPAGFDFGAAALRLSDSFRTAPVVDGRSVDGATAMIPMVFMNFDAQGRTQVALINNPPWIRTPSAADVKAAYPPQAASVAGGTASVRCDFQSNGQTRTCVVRQVSPEGLGFGEAAQKLAAGFVINARPLDAATLQLVNADIPFTFHNPAGPPKTQDIEPQWTRMLTTAGAARVFPAAARAAKVTAGIGRVDCAGTASGALTDCKVVGEEPAGLGFGEAAVAAAGQIAMNPWTAAGEPVEGRRITIPIQLKLQDPAPARR